MENKKHPNQRGAQVRLRFRALIDASTYSGLESWARHSSIRSRGDLLDKLFLHAKATGFDPGKPAKISKSYDS